MIQADRSILQRLVMAYQAGREVNLKSILQHELLPVPLSLAEMNSELRTGDKSSLMNLITTDIDCPSSIEHQKETSLLIIDGQALVVTLGRPENIATFGDFARLFIQNVEKSGTKFKRVDIVFDRYRDSSIKAATRQKRAKKLCPIRRVIENEHVPLPKNWKNFLALPENKANLASFLSEQISSHTFQNIEVVVAGGFFDERKVVSSNSLRDVTPLESSHEEADT